MNRTWRSPALILAVCLWAWAASFSSAYEPKKGPTPDEALKMLQEGNERFAADQSLHPRLGAARREATAAEGQHPLVTVVACSDSRSPVEAIFDQGIGDVFVIRVAGNVCNTDEIGTVEYGVGHLHTPLVVVLGHTSCGAVTAVVMGDKVGGSIPKLVAPIGPAAQKAKIAHPNLTGKDLIPPTIKANVHQAMEDLLTRSPEVREELRHGGIQVVGAIYDLSTGKVEWLGPHPDEKRLIAREAE